MVRCPVLAGTWRGVDHQDDIQDDLAACGISTYDMARQDCDIEVLNTIEYMSCLDCAVCEEQLSHPLRLSCGHAFCRGCLAALNSIKQKRCPLCEADVESIDPEPKWKRREQKTQSLKRTRTAEYLHRNLGVAQDNASVVYVRVGNTSSINCEGGLRFPQKWTLRVWLDRDVFPHAELNALTDWTEADLIKKVTFGLVPACRLLDSQGGFLPKTRTDPEVFHAPFEITGVSWGLFTVTVTVTWKDWLNLPPLQLQHTLTTMGEVGDSTHGVEFGACGDEHPSTLRAAAGCDDMPGMELPPGPPEIPGMMVFPPGVVELPLLQIHAPSSRVPSKCRAYHSESSSVKATIVEEDPPRKRRGLLEAKRWLVGLTRRRRASKATTKLSCW